MDAEQPDLRPELAQAADGGLMCICERSGQAQGAVLGVWRELPAVFIAVDLRRPGNCRLERGEEKLIHRVEGGHGPMGRGGH